MKIEAVIFDLGRVLVEVDLTRGIFRYSPEDRGRSEKEVLDILMQDDFYRRYATGTIGAEDFAAEICRRLNLDLDYEGFKRIWNDVFVEIEGMHELVQKVAANFRVGLLSDVGPMHWEYLRAWLPVLNFFPNPTLSYLSGVLKPDARAYRLAGEQVDCKPQSCLFIDDRIENVQGAKQVGMQALQFTGIEKLQADLKGLGIL